MEVMWHLGRMSMERSCFLLVVRYYTFQLVFPLVYLLQIYSSGAFFFYWTEVLHDQFNLLLPAVNVIFTKKNSREASFVHQSAWSVLQQNGIFVRYSPQNAIWKRELFEFCSWSHIVGRGLSFLRQSNKLTKVIIVLRMFKKLWIWNWSSSGRYWMEVWWSHRFLVINWLKEALNAQCMVVGSSQCSKNR